MNAREYYHRVIDRLKNCFQLSHYVVATGNELVSEGYDPGFPAAAEPIDQLERLIDRVRAGDTRRGSPGCPDS